MITDIDPIYANSCGKIFGDRIIFASPNRETVYDLDTIKKISFKKRYETGSIVFTFLPGILLFVPYFSGAEDTFIKVMFISVGLIGLAVSIAKAKAKYTVDVKTDKGGVAISVWEGNKNDARKFVEKANLFLAKKNECSGRPVIQANGYIHFEKRLFKI